MSDINANKSTFQARSLSLSGSRYSLVDSPSDMSPVPSLSMQHKGFKPPFVSTAAAQGEVQGFFLNSEEYIVSKCFFSRKPPK